MGMLRASPAWREGHSGTPERWGEPHLLLPRPSLPAGLPCFSNRSTASGLHAGPTAWHGGPSSCLSPFPQTVKKRPWKDAQKYSARPPSCSVQCPPAGHGVSEKPQSKETCLLKLAQHSQTCMTMELRKLLLKDCPCHF